MFYENFEFFINYTTSNVEITGLSTHKHDHVLGEPVKIDLELINSPSNIEDVVVNTVIKDQPASFLFFIWLDWYFVNTTKFDQFIENKKEVLPFDEWKFKQ